LVLSLLINSGQRKLLTIPYCLYVGRHAVENTRFHLYLSQHRHEPTNFDAFHSGASALSSCWNTWEQICHTELVRRSKRPKFVAYGHSDSRLYYRYKLGVESAEGLSYLSRSRGMEEIEKDGETTVVIYVDSSSLPFGS
jgi:hypothetical protein